MNDLQLGHGAIPSPVDERDWTLASAGASTVYPDSCFIDQTMMSVSMQAKIGCCVGCSFEEIMRIILIQQGQSPEELSYRFVYAVCKALDGVADEGTYPSLAAKVIRTYGVPLAKYCPNDTSLDHESFVYGRNLANIPAEAFADALTRKSGADLTEPISLDGIKKAINYAKQNKGGVAILRRIGKTYWVGRDGVTTWDKAKLLPIQVPTEFVGGHEEMLYGYDTEPETGRTRIYWLNHWSANWADNGRGWEYADEWLPYIVEMRVVVPKMPVVDSFTYNFRKVLSKGMQGADVVALQHCLKLEGCYPEGLPFTGLYGDKTTTGVKLFQTKYASEILTPLKLTTPTGNFGNATLKKMNQLYNK